MGANIMDGSLTDINKFALMIAVALGLALYLQILKKRFYWIVLETILGVVSLMLLPFADKMIENYQSTGTNSLALYLFRLMIFARTAQAAVIFLTRNSRDPTVAIGISISNILCRTAMLMCAFHGIYHTKTINSRFLVADVIQISLLIIGDMFQLTRLTTRDGSLTIGDPVSFHLSVDGLATFMTASWMFGFPEMFVHVLNPGATVFEGHLALAKVIGCMIFGTAVLSFAALCFKNNDDGVEVLKAKLVFYLPAVMFGVILVATNGQYRNCGHVTVLCGMGSLAANALYAAWEDKKEKSY